MSDDQLDLSVEDLYEHAPCGYIFTLPDGTFARVNKTFIDWTGYARDELLSGKRFQDLLTLPGRIFYENQYAPLLRMQGFVSEVAFDLVRAGRDPLPALVSSVQRPAAENRPPLTASIIFEATHRRTYERELLSARRKAEQLAAIVTSSSDAILSTSGDGVIETWNRGAEDLFGYVDGEIIGRRLQEILPTCRDGEGWDRIFEQLTEGHAVSLESVGLHADGQPIDVSVGLTPHLGLLGQLSGISAIMRDISERRLAERFQREFLAMTSHELRTPVTSIKGHAQVMQRRQQYNERSIESIVAQANQLGRLIDDLLLASRIEANQLDLRLADTDLVAQVEAAADHMRAIAPSIRVEAPTQPIPVLADRDRLAQVFANLLSNAAKFSPPGSEIVMRVTRDDGTARVEVIDQGVGISPDVLPHLFSRFYRVAVTAEREGLGLGLYISRRIVESHLGTISVESTPGSGSTFTVTLPLHAKPASADSPA